MTRLWPLEVWHIIWFSNIAYLASGSYPVASLIAKVMHIKSSDPLRSELPLLGNLIPITLELKIKNWLLSCFMVEPLALLKDVF